MLFSISLKNSRFFRSASSRSRWQVWYGTLYGWGVGGWVHACVGRAPLDRRRKARLAGRGAEQPAEAGTQHNIVTVPAPPDC
eukprot:CAMPEP_0119533954 /NCGR_PEP_ID=MMETSP1344-20130328/47268_1 /TAXON_ID=236787 /ORGANISM="Florenciella parvula, Strain CCMP2471" /LENGTH=81 /DNA_ID=CAMNT_0007575039 /DNA_START=1 /DNA_END=246 /DNA_ORIENTATION=-